MRQQGDLAAASSGDRLIAVGILVTCGLVLAQTTAQLVDYHFFDLRLKVINTQGDGGVFGIIGDLALLFAAAAAWAALPRMPTARPQLQLLAPLLTFLALDKALRLHDHIPHWLILYVPLLVAVFLLLVELARRTSTQARRLITAAVLLLTVSFLVHQYGDRILVGLHEPPYALPYQLEGSTKHGAELAGWLLVGLGIWASCRAPGTATKRDR